MDKKLTNRYSVKSQRSSPVTTILSELLSLLLIFSILKFYLNIFVPFGGYIHWAYKKYSW